MIAKSVRLNRVYQVPWKKNTTLTLYWDFRIYSPLLFTRSILDWLFYPSKIMKTESWIILMKLRMSDSQTRKRKNYQNFYQKITWQIHKNRTSKYFAYEPQKLKIIMLYFEYQTQLLIFKVINLHDIWNILLDL